MSSKEECRKQRKQSLICKTEQQKLPKVEYREEKNEQTSVSCEMTPSDISRRGEGCGAEEVFENIMVADFPSGM